VLRVPLPENSPLTLTAPTDPKVRFVEKRLVSGGLRERLQTAHTCRYSGDQRMTRIAPLPPLRSNSAGG
jgi:hypothetical protein